MTLLDIIVWAAGIAVIILALVATALWGVVLLAIDKSREERGKNWRDLV